MENDQRTGPSISNSTTGVSCSVLKLGPHSTFTVNVTDPPAKPKWTEVDVYYFEVQDPVESFHGRVEFLHRLHSSIQEGGETVLSQSKIIGGLGGVGKTETAKKYIQQFKHHYENVIWINAETKTSMEDSFKRLAVQLYPQMKDVIVNKPTDEIVSECYKIICQRRSLVVFDNAQFHADSTFGSDDGIEPFMPKSLQPNWKRPFFLITSRNLDWVNLKPWQLLELDILREDECLDFLKKELSSTMEVSEDDSKELGRVLGGLPLALTQAVAYIREKCRKKQLSRTIFTLSDYIKQFHQMQKQLLNYLPRDSKTQSTVMTTWSVTLDLMKTVDNGESAIWLSQVLSILSPDRVPAFVLRKIVKEKMDRDEFGEAMDILRRFAFVKYSDDQRSVNMHRLVQFIILEQLQKKEELEKLLDFIVESRGDFLPRSVRKSKLTDEAMTNTLCVVDKLRLFTSKLEFLLFQMQLARVYRWRFKSGQAIVLLKEVAGKLDQKVSKTIDCIINLELALATYDQDMFEECEPLLKTVSDSLPNHLEPDDPDVPEMMDERVKACVLAQEGKRQEALELKNKICDKKLTSWRSNNLCLFQSLIDPDTPSYNTVFLQFELEDPPGYKKVYQQWDALLEKALEYGLQIQNCEICTESNSIEILECLAKINESLDRRTVALKMYSEWYMEKEKILPADEPSLIQVSYHIFRLNLPVLYRMKRSDVCEDIRKILHEKLMTIKRPHHPSVLSTMMNFVISLKKYQMYKESLDVCGVLCEDGEVVWGQYDSRVLWAMENLAEILQYLDRHEEAVKVLKIVDERKCKDFQQYSPKEAAQTKYLVANLLRNCGKFEESLEIFEVVRKIYEKIFHPSDIGVLKVLEDMSDVLWSLKRFDESISILQDMSVKWASKCRLAHSYDMSIEEKLATRKKFLRQKHKKGKKCRLV